MRKTSLSAALGAVAAAALLAACGTTDPGTETAAGAGTQTSAASTECAADNTATATGPVELTDSYGRTVKLDKPATRVAVLEWQQVEDVLTLCVTPVAVADPKGYSLWDTAEKLPEGVVDVGTRGEPNLDTLYGTNPDLVIVEAYTAEDEIIKKLEKYDVPVLATKGADAADPIANMKNLFTLIAKATGREERATAVLADFDASLAEAKQKVDAAAPASKEFLYFDGWIDGGNVALRPFGQGSLVGELGESLGLANAWTGDVDPAYGLGQTDIEGMTKVGSASFFYTSTEDPDTANFVDELAKNPIWSSLPAVKENRVKPFPSGIWTFGGPRSSQQILDAFVAAVAG